MVIIFTLVALALAILVSLKGACQSDDACAANAGLLGEGLDGRVLSGELEGIPVWMGMEMHEVAEEGLIQFCVVRAKVPGPLPRGFVAAPRRWTPEPGPMPTGDLFSSGDPELDEMYLFQSEERDEGRAFVQDSQVQQALRSVLGSGQVAFVEQGHAGIASVGVITETEEAQRKFAAVVRAAQGLTESGRVAAGR
ncbi:hypothetical protein SAMN05444354_10749 [Stigmatella aurantiaca]|uniref:Uncharacterized protein n=1 Tax=Stigmatella aurantiaca TaxID=41 RepID=A0A1H7RHE7_STIAU|nr:hypothetical protein [Stigmatella aurantiaca]SEL59646.1 hypothetical protein SAMN05444354_10749 [Stigmatella aurantiaca]